MEGEVIQLVSELCCCFFFVVVADLQDNPIIIDETLISSMSQNGEMLLKMESDLELFLNDTTQTKFSFPPSSSYLRLIAHRLAHHFNLKHTVVTIPGGGKCVCVLKTEDSKLPPVRLSDLFPEVADTIPREEPPQSKPIVTLLRRNTPKEEDRNTKTNNSTTQVASSVDEGLSMEEREAKYLEAKVRIFGREVVESHAVEDALISSLEEPEPEKKEEVVAERKPIAPPPSSSSSNKIPLKFDKIPEFVPKGIPKEPVQQTPLSRPPARSGKLFDPNSPAYTMSSRSKTIPFAIPETTPRIRVQTATQILSGRMMDTAHIKIISLLNDSEVISVTNVMQQCSPFAPKCGRLLDGKHIVVSFPTVLNANKAEEMLKETLKFESSVVVCAITDPNAGTGGFPQTY